MARYQYMQLAPWLSIAPGMAIFLTVLALNLGCAAPFDPRLWGQRADSS
jgi:ABC-type dipeptide/oligopeptide/nickel transport system permease subunit